MGCSFRRNTMQRGSSQVSEQHSAEAKLSSVAEISALAHEAADFTAGSSNWKDRVQAAARAFGMSFGRAKRVYFKEVRRVDAEEMDVARAAVEQLREAALQRQSAGHMAWLRSTVEHLRQTDEEFHRFDVDGLERALARAGAPGGAVGHSSAEFDADFDQRKWGR
jgi:hypothetical protein